MSNVRVIELGEDLTLDFEPRLNPARATVNHLDGHLLLEFGVCTFGEENLPHTADTQGAQHAIRPYAVSFHGLKHAPPGCGGGRKHGGSCGGVLLACMRVGVIAGTRSWILWQTDTTLINRLNRRRNRGPERVPAPVQVLARGQAPVPVREAVPDQAAA